jgi:uncharacterized protein (DUF1800 family)
MIAGTMTGIPVFAQGKVIATISPKAVTLPAGADQRFTVTILGVRSAAITWKVDDVTGGNSVLGTIDSTGKYTAPAVPPSGYTVTIKAAGTSSPGFFAIATVTIRNQTPVLTSVMANSFPVGPFNLTVNGSGFVSGAVVMWNGMPLMTNFVNSEQLTATGNATQPGTFSITVANPGPGAVSTALPVTVTSATASIVVTVAPNSVTLLPGATQQYQASVAPSSVTQAVTWLVNGIAGGGPSVGTITAGGLYTAPAVVPAAGSVVVSALSAADGVTKGTATAFIQSAVAATVSITNGRFLEQTSFGPTAQSLTHLQQIGMQAFLNEQFAMPESTWPPLATASRSDAVDAFFANASTGQDQLRQRMIFALSEIIVVAMNKNTNGDMIVPWLQLLSRNAFGNYHTLLKELTLDSSMAWYLDLANSGVGGGAANENYPREVMQLFSIGLYKLNPDGSQQLDAMGQPIPTYTQTDVQQLAKALTGWTYSNATGTTGSGGNWSYFAAPMIPVPGRHDTSAKTILGQPLPAGQTAQQDLDGAINIIFNHPNMGPFIATRLIRALVTSNPSPAYIARIAAVFNENGQGVRGDLQAVIQATIMDQEARNDTPPANFGRLRTPTQHTIAMARALNLNIGPVDQFAYLFYYMDEGILDAPSVFGHYSPTYHIPRSSLFGPEFQIYSTSDAINRANFFYELWGSPWPINPALQPLVNVAGDSNALINTLDNTLLYGRMLPQTRAAIAAALPSQYDNNARVLTALYLTAMSGEYLVQH